MIRSCAKHLFSASVLKALACYDVWRRSTHMIAIIDYSAGNLASVERAVSHLGYTCTVTTDTRTIEEAERIIFPGVGAARSAMESLKKQGLDAAITRAFGEGKPILGICLGTQIIMAYSEENDVACFGIIEGTVRRFPADLKGADRKRLKIPHMGWNRVSVNRDHPVLADIHDDDEYYFVHGFYPDPDDRHQVLGETDYGITFASIIGVRNLIATQFHPEKSGRPGLALLKNFCEWQPTANT